MSDGLRRRKGAHVAAEPKPRKLRQRREPSRAPAQKRKLTLAEQALMQTFKYQAYMATFHVFDVVPRRPKGVSRSATSPAVEVAVPQTTPKKSFPSLLPADTKLRFAERVTKMFVSFSKPEEERGRRPERGRTLAASVEGSGAPPLQAPRAGPAPALPTRLTHLVQDVAAASRFAKAVLLGGASEAVTTGKQTDGEKRAKSETRKEKYNGLNTTTPWTPSSIFPNSEPHSYVLMGEVWRPERFPCRSPKKWTGKFGHISYGFGVRDTQGIKDQGQTTRYGQTEMAFLRPTASPLLQSYATDHNAPRSSVTSNSASLGLKKQNPVRVPLAALIVAIVVVVAGLVGGLVGYLTISDALSSIKDITLQMRLSILEKTADTVNTTLVNAVVTMRSKVSDAVLFDWMNLKKWEDGFLNYPEMFFVGVHTVVTYSVNSTSSQGQLFAVIGVSNFRPIISPNALMRGPSITPHAAWPTLANNGIVPGKPFFATLSYVNVAQTLFIPLIWPVWRNESLGIPGPGPYWAAHVAAISLNGLEEFLRTLKVSQNGIVAIVEGSTGLMVSATAANASYDAGNGTRFPAVSSPNPWISAAATHMANTFGNGIMTGIPADSRDYDLVFPALGDDVLVNARWLVDYEKGVKWLVMVIIPSNDFLASIKRSITRTMISVVCICLAGVGLAIFSSWAITAPLRKLVKAMIEATAFDFSALGEGYLSHRSHVKEIGLLQGVFNEMLVNFASAIRVNKSLSPAAIKRLPNTTACPLLKPTTSTDDPSPHRASVASNAVSLGLKKQNPIRVPLAAFIVAIVVLVAGLVGGLVGFLTINDALSTINDITLQMRLAILEKTMDTVNSTLENAVAALSSKVSDVALFEWINAKKWEDGFQNYPEILGIYASAAMFIPHVSAAGIVFYPNEQGFASGFFFNVDPRLTTFVIYSANSTAPQGQLYAATVAPNFRPILSPNPIATWPPLPPHAAWPPLSRNGLVPGRPFFSSLVFVAEAQSLFFNLIWPVWRNLSLGVPGPGSYWAVHVAAISLDGLEKFMRTLKVSRNGIVAIVEGSTGLMVSTSAANATWDINLGTRFPAALSPNPWIAAAATHLADVFGNGTVLGIPADRRRYDLVFPALGDDVLVNAQWLVDNEKGLKWLVMVIIPSNDFLASTKRSITRTIVSVVCICVAGVALAIVLTWAITAPLITLVKAMVEATAFDFSALGEGYLSHR
ncbi:hypothetical protein HDU96_006803 [Phlyctochytrium bullatum]|nr:hypothetical protein HDU96_006803 [Phlyctochytrium bullatum]